MAADLIGRTAVYRLYAGDVLLYVGISYNPDVRFSQHARKPWRWMVDHREIDWYPSRAKAEAVERQAILDEQPLFNVEHNGRRGDMWALLLDNPTPTFGPRRLLQFAQVVYFDPRLLDLAWQLARAGEVCGDCIWDEARNDIKRYVGYQAEDPPNDELRSSWAYEVTVAAFYELLPWVMCEYHLFDSYHAPEAV